MASISCTSNFSIHTISSCLLYHVLKLKINFCLQLPQQVNNIMHIINSKFLFNSQALNTNFSSVQLIKFYCTWQQRNISKNHVEVRVLFN